MPRTMTPTEVGGTTLASAYQKIRALQQREWAAGERVNRYYRELTQSYKQTLDDAFYRYFVYPADQAPHWDALAVQRSDVTETLTDAFDEVVADLDEETAAASDEEMEEAFLQGWYYGLWDVHQTGQDVDGVEPPDTALVKTVIAGAAIGGLSLLDRARMWLGEGRLKFRTGIRATTIGEATLPQTEEWFDGIANFLQQRVSGLVVNELHRAFELGQAMAVSQYPSILIGEVWVTRQDLSVCPFCRSLHMKVTELKPVIDSHPGCRCFKIPILDGAGARPVDFDYFMNEVFG